MNERIESALLESPRLYRAPVIRSKPKRIDREGGDYGAGLIRDAAVLTSGEALGWESWIDDVMLQQTADAINATSKGVKARFAHPSESSDGIGKMLGRWQNARVAGEVVRADLHFLEAAHKAPDGDLADYVMDLAEEDAESFGASIAFDPDLGEEARFTDTNLDKNGVFQSPDKRNTNNYRHVRLAYLVAADVVDSPAANPEGLFHQGHEFLGELEPYMEFALGIRPDVPDGLMFGVDPKRARGYVARFLAAHGLRLERVPGWREKARARELVIERES